VEEEVKVGPPQFLNNSGQDVAAAGRLHRSVDLVGTIGGGVRLSVMTGFECGGGRYWIRTSDLMRVKHAL
jgi:hypothetical protein